ncbi:MAG: tRNA (adenosine(37)-N6)-threonylcarbamoyltransferase complex dimerization subunit type 1 TsaB [Gammaproteobacteria bacterium]|jgi:tRNA threonylcarbamoyladenosine biosynthesis protein TsaB|nr:tRNA (adenosine(37)-N6)-threonylcarbamoyltransferase complex dimerization subunit type 1 TsaB [Gammaproteobacteria bacterium]
MKLLALETAGPWCSAALMIGDQIEQRLEDAPRRHADLILGMIDGLLQEADLSLADLDAVVYGRGPGSFTGVRIAAAVAQGIAFGAGSGVIGVSTLAATAQSARRQTGQSHLACALDARMGEVYWAYFEAEPGHPHLRLIEDECVVAPERVPLLPDRDWCAVGDGWNVYPSLYERQGERISERGEAIRAEAQDLLLLAQLQIASTPPMRAADALPRYLRNHVAEVSRSA